MEGPPSDIPTVKVVGGLNGKELCSDKQKEDTCPLLSSQDKKAAAANMDDVGRMLDAVSSNAKFSFKDGFFSESEADLNRYRLEPAHAKGKN